MGISTINASTHAIGKATALSILLHSAVLAAFVSAPEPVTSGKGLDIQLIRSITQADRQETDVARKSESLAEKVDIAQQDKKNHLLENSEKKLTVTTSEALISAVDVVEQEKVSEAKENSQASISRSTNAIPQQDSILSLLHASISEEKQYPYIARRQRREGVATVSFVLHPDGTIEDTHLVLSSSANTLDRAALSAVKRIEPFKPATQYLERAETFKVDVVFSLL